MTPTLKPLHQAPSSRRAKRVKWDTPGTVVRGIFMCWVYVGTSDEPYGFVSTGKGKTMLDGTEIQEFSLAPPDLARQLQEKNVSPGTLVSLTYVGLVPGKAPEQSRKAFRVQAKPYGTWDRVTVQLSNGSIIGSTLDPSLLSNGFFPIGLDALTSRWTSIGARIERVLASRLVELERLLDDTPTPENWAEYYRVCDLWLRSRAPMPSTPPITRAQLTERFKR
jgi:hypothetical protein